MIRLLRWLGERGGAAVEFALVAPPFLLLVLGGLEIGHTMYVRSVLVGSLQKAARDLTLEDANAQTRQDTIISTVRTAVQQVIPSADVQVVAKSYHDYSNAQSPMEKIVDSNSNGICDPGESFIDSNRDGVRDDGSVNGRGGARDVVLLTATVSYDRLPLGRMFTADPRIVLTSKTLLRNQPNDQQADPPLVACPS